MNRIILRSPRIVDFWTGIILLSLGISLTITAGLGVSPFDALLVGLSVHVGLTIGSWEILLALIMIFLNAVLIRQKPEFKGLLTAFATGLCIDTWLWVIGHWLQVGHFVNFIYFIVGMLVSGWGTAMYLRARFARIPVDHLMVIIQLLTKKSVMYSRTLIYIIFFILAFLFQGPIGIGTVLTVCFGGAILHFFMGRLNRNNVITAQKS